MQFTQIEIDAAVKSITRAGKTMARGVEQVLVMAVYDSIVNKSAITANALVSVLRKSTKRTGIVGFLEQYGQLFNKPGAGFVHFAIGAAAKLEWDADYCAQVKEEAMHWEDFKAEVKAVDYDVIKALEAVVKKANGTGVVLDKDLAAYIPALIAQYTAKKALAGIHAEIKAGKTKADPVTVAA